MEHSQPEQSDRAVTNPHDGALMYQREIESGPFPDDRLGKRLGRLLAQFADGTAERAPFACRDAGP